jgi:recombinational DNA repair protein (RecF pathway)
MLSTTDAIVLSLQPHSDKAHVLHAYTRAGGRINYMVYGLGRKNPLGLYTPLSLVQITASCPPNGVPTVKEVSLSPFSSGATPFIADPYKRTIALFISEILYNVLRHPMPDEPMFDFLAQAIAELDRSEEPQNFHLLFLIGFAAKLGFEMEETPSLPRTREERQQALRTLCAYFAEHVETWQNPKSLDILMEVFD